MNRVAALQWLEIVRFELAYQSRRRALWIIFAVLLFPLIGETNGQVLEALEREILFHSPLFIAQSSVGMALIAMILMAAVAGDAATRDIETRVEPLMHAAPISRAVYLGGRFAGAFIVIALLLSVVPLALIAAPFVHESLTPELVGPFRPAAHLQSFFGFVLPNAFIATAVMFALATLMRHTIGSYFGAAAVLMTAVLVTEFIGDVAGRWDLAQLLDPSCHALTMRMGKTWSPGDVNARLIGWDAALVWNRLLWLVVAAALLGFTYARFRYGANTGTARWWRRGRAAHAGAAELDARAASVPVPDAPRDFGAGARVRQTLSIVRDSLRETATGWCWFAVALLALQILSLSEGLDLRGAPTVPTTSRILEAFGAAPPPIAGAAFFFAILFAGELVWRERDANIQALTDAAPVPIWSRFVGKLLALWLAVAGLHAVKMLAGVIVQLQLGRHDLDPLLYVQTLFGLQLTIPLIFALLALSVHVLVNQKHVGHVVFLGLVIGGIALGEWLGIDHPLLSPFAAPGWRHSSISGFGSTVGPFLWFVSYWASWTVLFAITAGLFWVRGAEPRIFERVRIARRRINGRTVAAVTAMLGVIALVGGFIFYNTNIQNEYHGSAELAERRVEYERRYGQYENVPQPELTATRLVMEIHPDRHAAEVRGEYHVTNRTPQPIDTIHVAVSPQVATSAIDFGRAARAEIVDDDLGHRVHVLSEPLQPGDSLRMSFEVCYEQRGFTANGIGKAVVANGSFIEMHKWLPQIGYQSGRELSDALGRKKHGLPAQPEFPSLDDIAARSDPRRHQGTDLDVIVGTDAGQIAVAPGELREKWNRDGRNYFHYATDASIGIGYAIFSADYAVRSSRWNDITLEIVHHPAHDLNVESMMRSMQASVAQYTERFGPYRYNVLRMIEWPGEGAGGAHAASGAIWYEAVLSLLDAEHDERRIDLLFGVVAHEVAHQFQPALAAVEGGGLLSESFAWYAALGVIEKEQGTEHLERFLEFMRRDYLDPRARADVPLLRAADKFLAYRKGPFAMYALREYVGQDKVDLAWRQLIAQHASLKPPFATSLDLYRELKLVTPDSLQYLLADLIERNTFWELETRKATAEQTSSGEWRVTLDVVARKVVVDTEGVETNMPMDDLIEIGVYARAETGAERGTPLHLAMHRITTGSQPITVTVPEQPARAGIDPRRLLIDVETRDNLADIKFPTQAKN